MSFRYGKSGALRSWIFVALIYLGIVFLIIMVIFPKFFMLHYETLLILSIFAMWRYGWMFLNYTRAFIYAKFAYPARKKRVENISEALKYPKKIYFIIPSYQEDEWVSVETFRSIFLEISSIPSEVILVVSTSSKEEDSLIQKIFDTYKPEGRVKLIFQHQSQGKRISMGHALRAVSRDYHDDNEDRNSVTIFMDGDSYMERGFLKKLLPFFAEDDMLGAVTTNEAAYINSKNSWYKDWFRLKFGQRHILFQAHSLSKKVMTLTGRLSAYRTSIVVEDDFIKLIENDILTTPIHGKFRFLMGDDKSSWFYLLRSGWDMIYLPDLLCISLESRDGNFLELSRTLPYRWFGNTLRNNTRALKLKPWNIGWYIWYAILDQRLIMWTSLVGISSAVALGIFSTWYYLFFFIAWVIVVRVLQLFVIALGGHKVSWRMPLLLLYTQWVGAFVKIKAYYNLSDQQWSKNGKKQKMDSNKVHIEHPLVPLMPKIMMFTSISVFIFLILLVHNILKVPSRDLLPFLSLPSSTLQASTDLPKEEKHIIYLSKMGVTPNNKTNAKIVNKILSSYDKNSDLVLVFPKGDIAIYEPININRSHVTIKGEGKDKTRLISYIKGSNIAVIDAKGSLVRFLGKLDHSLHKFQSFFILPFLKDKEDYLLVREPNDKNFLSELGSKKWDRRYPYLRQEIVKVIGFDDRIRRIDLENPLLTDFDKNLSEVYSINMLENINIEDLTIKQINDDKKIKDFNFIYKNMAKDIEVDEISFEYVANSHIKNLRLLQSGRHPIRCNFCYGVEIEGVDIDGAWNKGNKGNGYVRFARTFHSKFTNSHVKNIRHLTLQWSSCGNILKDLFLEVDINFHGGFAHDNYVRDIRFSIPKKHHWKAIEKCPDNASWAPPDGVNRVVYESIKYK